MTDQTFPEYLAIKLSISSERLSPATITKTIGIEPISTRERGAPMRNGMTRRPEFDLFEWQLREQLDVKPGDYIGNYTENFINEFFLKIKDSAPRIKELSEENSVLISLVYQVHEIPFIGLTRQNVEILAALGAQLDYDIMV